MRIKSFKAVFYDLPLRRYGDKYMVSIMLAAGVFLGIIFTGLDDFYGWISPEKFEVEKGVVTNAEYRRGVYVIHLNGDKKYFCSCSGVEDMVGNEVEIGYRPEFYNYYKGLYPVGFISAEGFVFYRSYYYDEKTFSESKFSVVAWVFILMTIGFPFFLIFKSVKSVA